jgi:hypothetical protein
MELGDAGEALRAKAEQAKRHAKSQVDEAREQRVRATEQREAEEQAVDAARESVELDGPLLQCVRCAAIWRREAIVEATRRHQVCLMCGGPLVPAEDDQ